MQGRTADGRTLAREAYFLAFAKELAVVARMPVMTTGGIARAEVVEQVLASGVAVAGIATALAEVPDLPLQWCAGHSPSALPPPVDWKDKGMQSLATMALAKCRMRKLAAGPSPEQHYSPLLTLIIDQLRTVRLTRRYRAWLAAYPV